LNNNRTSPDNCVVAYLDTSLDDDTVTNVDVLTNVDFSSDFSALAAFLALRVSWCLQGRDSDTGTNLGVSSNGNSGRVEELAVRTDTNILGNGDVVTIITVEWRCNVHVATQMTTNWSTWAAIHVTWMDPTGRYDSLKIALSVAA
jgi:hypothetical protein